MTKKVLYRHKGSGDLFAIETDGGGNVLSTAGPLLSKELDPEKLTYDNYRVVRYRGRSKILFWFLNMNIWKYYVKMGFILK